MKLKEIIAFYRVKDWLHMLGLVLLGYVYSRGQDKIMILIAGFSAAALYLAHGYSLNDIYDRQLKVDLSYKKAMLLSFIALFLCLAASGIVSLELLGVAIFGHLCGMLYSARPFRLKNRFLLDLVFNALALASLFLMGYLIKGGLSAKPLALFFMFFVYFLPTQLVHQIQDRKIDAEYRQDNTFQLLGIEKTKKMIYFLLFIYALLGIILLRAGVLGIASALSTILFSAGLALYTAMRIKSENRIAKEPKMSTRYLSMLYGAALLVSFYLGN